MRKITFTIFILFIVNASTFGQDLIVTTDNDSINCRIAKVSSDFIYFSILSEGEINNTLMPSENILVYTYAFFKESSVPPSSSPVDSNYPHFSVGINGGFSYMTAKISDQVPDDYADYIKDLKSGYHISAEASFFLSKIYGLGIYYSNFRTSNSTSITLEDDNGNLIHGELADRISVNYIGPIFTTRFLNKGNDGGFLLSLSLGYTGYKNNATYIENFDLTGNTVGFRFGMNYDIQIAESLLFSIGFSYTGGSLSKLNIKAPGLSQTIELEKGQYESVSHIDLSIGFKFVK